MLRLLSDPTRVRILAAVEDEELAVNEIADVLDMGQSRISNHLRLLKGGAALEARREGAWTFYRNALAGQSQNAALWTVVKEGLRNDPDLAADHARRRDVLERRRERSREYFAEHSQNGAPPLADGRLREEILAALAPHDWTVLDIGCGDGYLTEMLASRFAHVIAVDHAPRRLKAASRRIAHDHVTFAEGEVDDLPVESGSVDAAFLSMVLHHVPEIGAALAEAYRVLKPGGRLVIADLAPHDEESMREVMGDLRLGVSPQAVAEALARTGFANVRTMPARDRIVPAKRKNLSLYLATGERPRGTRRAKTRKR